MRTVQTADTQAETPRVRGYATASELSRQLSMDPRTFWRHVNLCGIEADSRVKIGRDSWPLFHEDRGPEIMRRILASIAKDSR